MSERLAGVVAVVWTDVRTPWWPHYGVWLELNSKPSTVLARKLCKSHFILPAPAAADGAAERAEAEVSSTSRDNAPQKVDKAALWERAWAKAQRTSVAKPAAADCGDEGKAVLEYVETLGGF